MIDGSSGCSHCNHSSTVTLRSPSNRSASSTSTGLSSSTNLAFSSEEGNYVISTTTYYNCSCQYGARVSFGGGSVWPIGTFRAVFKKNHYDSLKAKWVYLKDSSYCNGTCQASQWCSTSQYEWLYIYGLRITSPAGIAACIPIPPYPRGSQTRPECRQTFGLNMLSGDNECN